VNENGGKFEIEIRIAGTDRVPVAVEFGFARGGELSGVVAAGGAADAFLLESGTAEYRFNDETIGSAQAEGSTGIASCAEPCRSWMLSASISRASHPSCTRSRSADVGEVCDTLLCGLGAREKQSKNAPQRRGGRKGEKSRNL